MVYLNAHNFFYRVMIMLISDDEALKVIKKGIKKLIRMKCYVYL